MATVAMVALFTTAGWWLDAAPSDAAPGPAATVTVALSPASIVANGSSTSTVTATVLDATSAPVPGDTVTFSASPGGVSIGPVTDNRDGTYAATLTSSTSAGPQAITATDSSVTPNVVSPPTTLTETPAPASSMTLSLNPASIVANGTSFSTATATLRDANGNPVTSDVVKITSSTANENVSATTNNSDGTYSATISSTKAGQATIVATDSTAGLSKTATLTQAPGRATSVSVGLSKLSIVANGTSTDTVTATVTDAHGNPVAGDTIMFSASDGGIRFGGVSCVTGSKGTCTATLTSSLRAGTPTVTAADITAGVSGHTTLTQTAGTAKNVSVQLSPAAIVANGTSTSKATAALTDANGNPVSNDKLTFSATDPGIKFSSVAKNGNGSYSATLTGTTTAGTPVITATDTTAKPQVSGQATLTQTPGSVTVQVSPASIVANGTSTSTATATVTDANGKPLANQTVVFSSSDAGETIGPVSSPAAGTYAATITSSVTSGLVAITATVTSLAPSPVGVATLTQAPNPSTTELTSVPGTALTNQPVTLIATVTSSSGVAPPSGTIAFENGGTAIGACAAVPVATTNQSATVTCQTSFAASTSAEQLTAVFSATAGSNIADSTSPTDAVTVTPDPTSTALKASSSTVHLGSSVSYSATVAPVNPGPVTPTGSVEFLDGKRAITSCGSQLLTATGTATCRRSYKSTGTHHIRAIYLGDANFAGSASSTRSVKTSRLVLGTVTSVMEWTFFYTPSYTKVLALVVNGAPVGAVVLVQCHGGGCPFAKRSVTVSKRKPCKSSSKHACPPRSFRTVDLIARFPHLRNQHLQIGARVMVKIIRSRWIGKYYAFVMRARHAPRVQISCLAPGVSRPGVGC